MRAFLVLAALLLAPVAAAQERIGVRTGDHPGFGRIVFDWTTPPPYRVETSEGRAVLRVPDADRIDLGGARRLPRNLLAVNRIEGGIELVLRPGAQVRHFRNGPKVAIDILDPVADAAAGRDGAPRTPSSGASSTARPAAGVPRTAPASSAGRGEAAQPPRAETREATPHAPTPAPLPPASLAPEPAPGPLPLASEPLRAAPAPAAQPPAAPALATTPSVLPSLPTLAGPPPVRARAVLRSGLPSALRLVNAGEMGLAVFRRGGQAWLVLDGDRVLELGALPADRNFQGAQVQRLAGASLLTWTLPAEHRLRVEREGSDWLITPVPRATGLADPAGPRPRTEGSLIVFPSEHAARVVPLTDAQTGLPLLVGTVSAPDLRLPATRSFPDADLLETFLGVAILARSEQVALRPGAGRFLLTGLSSPRLADAGTTESAAGLTRSFDFPAQPPQALIERLRAQQGAVAAAPPLLRPPLRVAAAETMIALGMPQEAQAMLRLAAQEVAEAGADPRLRFLSGVAALLAGRAPDAGALDASLPVTDEVIFWRALRDAAAGEPRSAAAAFAATAGLVFAYPEGLRRRLLPVVAETLASGGEPEAAARLLAHAGDDPALMLARAMTEDALGEAERALELYAAAAQSRDRLIRARALRLGVERRLALGRIDAATAARQLEETLFAWRGDAEELATRERIAALRREAGDPRGALAMLLETQELFPEQAAALRAPSQAAFLHALETEAPLHAVALFDARPELLPDDEGTPAVLERLAERLVALDLAERASGLLQRAMERLPPGSARAGVGARLAELRLSERDALAALAALAASSARDLPGELVARRAILAARAEAQRGQVAVAVEALRALGAAGDLALADILSDSRDYGGAAAALARHVERSLPPAPHPLDLAGQRQLVRLAVLRALAGEEAILPALRAEYANRITDPALLRAFDLLTLDPVRGLADLPRLARELELFRSLPLRTAQRAG